MGLTCCLHMFFGGQELFVCLLIRGHLKYHSCTLSTSISVFVVGIIKSLTPLCTALECQERLELISPSRSATIYAYLNSILRYPGNYYWANFPRSETSLGRLQNRRESGTKCLKCEKSGTSGKRARPTGKERTSSWRQRERRNPKEA